MELFAELSVLIVIATVVAVIMRLLRQPLIIGHILTGLIVGPIVLDLVHSVETLALLGEIGIAILLFTVGLHLNPQIIQRFGRVSLITGLGQVTFTSVVGYLVCLALGFDSLTSFYIAVALSFSSTIIIMKLIADKGDLDVLYAKIAIGFLLVQDLIAVMLLLGVPLFSSSNLSFSTVIVFLLSGVVLIAFVILASRFFISRANTFISESHEFLLLFAIAWGIGIAALFQFFGFSLESGALIAGIALASLPARHEISARLMPLRDFFIVMFFIFLGSQMQLGDISNLIPTAIGLSLLVLIGNPIILMIIMGLLGYRKKTSLQTGFTVAQISEFSLILVALALSLGHVEQSVLSLVTLVGLITIFGSTYLVMYSDQIYTMLAPALGMFERKGAHEPRLKRENYTVVLFGCNRIGYDFLESFVRMGERFLVVDHDPETIRALTEGGVAAEFGDAGDPDFLESIDLSKAELVISTIPDNETNHLIYKAAKAANPRSIVMVVAHRVADALAHYEEGIDYVILPHFLGGQHAAELVVKFKTDRTKYEALRGKHIQHLQLRIAIGHEHPRLPRRSL
ncbi:sodium:proton exchanger [Candidatus Kaiserbacteria bacterium CG10_big_fil_rev_8_21_14_0_10_51_14]|uniref:Sodium:proton exchanger n=1 Tax=Candidatus Kaiserbacteria bacterium CG10_big_fil_rev_8_21_14_0_10_51_14 TaxID=1974610 RepID=A0A2H0UEK9_9BACT|nr:MAG: sodium:proton exchanger [Candidatus Kaiserbacteria bacterium CG10_big_fil_rev_8_21_14_0_10_51_14]